MSWADVGIAGLFLGACGGLAMGLARALNYRLPVWLPHVHGLLNLSCLSLLLIALLFSDSYIARGVWWGVVVLTGALIGGLLFFRVFFPISAPPWLAGLHGAVGTLGIYLVLPATSFF